MRYDTITRVIFASRLADTPTALLLGLVLGTCAMGVALVARSVTRRSPTPGLDGRVRIYALGRARNWAVAFIGLVVIVVLMVPLAVLVTWWLRGTLAAGGGSSGLGESLASLLDPAVRSTVAGVVTGAMATALLLPAAYLAARSTSIVATAANVMIASTFALPGLVIALAVVYWVLQAPAPLDNLYQSFPLLIAVYVVHFGVQSHQSSAAAVRALPHRYGEAARVLGAGAVRRFFTIDLPLIAPAALAGGGLVMLSVLKELPATLLLAPTGFDTLATRVWGAAEDGFLAEVGVTSLALILLSGVLTWILILRPASGGSTPQRQQPPAEGRRG